MLVEERTLPGGEANMLGFETLTFAPIDKALTNVAMLSAAERDWLNGYHANVLRIVSPQVDGDAKAWLEVACAVV